MITQKSLGYMYDRQAMPSTKIGAFFKEFPWLKEWTGESPHGIYVYPISRELLTYEREQGQIDPEDFFNEQLEFLDASGKLVVFKKEVTWNERKYFGVLGPVVCRRKLLTINGNIGGDIWCYRETVQEVIEALGEKAPLVRFILSRYGRAGRYIIYKVPKNCTLVEWMDNEQDREASKIRKACDRIDADDLSARV